MKYTNGRIAAIVGAVFLFVWILPYLILGEDAHAMLHDNLDSGPFINQLAVKYFFDFSGTIPEFVNLDVRAMYPFSTFQLLLYAILPLFWAYIANEFIIKLIAYTGMYLFLGMFFPAISAKNDEKNYLFVTLAVSVIFAWCPFYSAFGLTAAGLPMLAWAFWNVALKHRETTPTGDRANAIPASTLALCFLYIAFFGFSSALILNGYFVLTVLFGFCAYFLYKKEHRKKQIWFYLATALLLVIYIVCNFKFISLMLSGYQSHRVVWDAFTQLPNVNRRNFIETILYFFIIFGFGYLHAGSNHSAILLICTVVLLFGRRDKKNILWKWISWIFLLNAIIAAVNALFTADIWSTIMTSLGLGAVNIGRLYYVLPFTWYVAGALALAFIWEKIMQSGNTQTVQKNDKVKLARTVTVTLCALSFVFVSTITRRECHVSVFTNYAAMLGVTINGPSYREWFDENLFKTIDEAIGRDKTTYRVGSIGMHPAIAMHNGFRTVDVQYPSYSFEYWQKFRSVIADELSRDPGMDAYFNWGNRCYLLASDIYTHRSWYNFMYNKNSTAVIKTLDYNIEALKDVLGGEYIFSAVPILTPPDGLAYVDCFEGDYWKIYLYKVNI
jgi:hypothetical protein